jgi:hypothetical protein
MTTTPAPLVAAPEALQLELTRERVQSEARAAEAEETLGLARSGLDALAGLACGLPDELRHTFGNGLTTTLYALGMVAQQLTALAKENPCDGAARRAAATGARGRRARPHDRARSEDVLAPRRRGGQARRPAPRRAVVDQPRVGRDPRAGQPSQRIRRGALRPGKRGAPRTGVHQPLAECRASHPGGRANRHEIHITTGSDAAGHVVVVATAASEVLERIATGERFDLILCDQ